MEERRAFNDRIQEELYRSNVYNLKPDPRLGARAARTYRNRYRNQHPPIFPKTIYREPQRPPQPRYHSRFFGGIPRG